MNDRAPTGVQDKLDRAFLTLASYSARHPIIVLALALALMVAGFSGATKVRQDNSLESYFDESDATFSNYQAYIREFSSDEAIYLLYAAPDAEHGVFNLGVMRKIDALTRTLERELPFARKVTSLTNVEFMEADGDDIYIHGMLDHFPETQEALLKYRDRALSKPIYRNALISPDGRFAGLMIEMTRTSTDPLEKLRHDPGAGDALDNLYPQVPNTVLRSVLSRPEFSDIQFWITGDVPMNAAYNEVINDDIAIMGLVNLMILMPLSMLFVRIRLVGLFAPIAVVMLSMMLIIGLMGWVGWRINLFFMMVPALIIAVGVAQAIHVILAWQQQIDAGETTEALQKAIGKVGTPCLLAAVTTSIGFLGMTTSSMRSLHELGWYTAFGVMCTFFLSMTLLVALTATLRPKARQDRTAVMERTTAAAAEINIKYRRTVLAISALIVLFAIVGIARVKIDFNFLTEFKSDMEFRQHTEKVNDVMGGVLSVVFVLDTGAEDGIKDPALLAALEAAQQLAETHPVVVNSISVVDIVKEMNQAFHGDDPAFYRLPESRQELAQLLLVYELSGGKEINDLINLTRSRTALQVRLKMLPASRIRDFLGVMQQHFSTSPLAGQIEVSGIGVLWVRMADYIADTQIKSYSVVFTLIAALMIIAFGSVKVGLLGMIPNLFPIVFCMGLMGWLNWDLDYLRMSMATIAIGIAVDDTIHMLARLRSEFRTTGRYDDAVRGAMRGVGPALIATTVILSLAFLSFLLSHMAVMASFGVLLSTAIVMALLADLFLLPALVLWLKPFGPERSDDKQSRRKPIGAEI